MNERVKELRKKLGLTQISFGEKLGLGGDTISAIEKGKNNLTDRNIALICEKFGVDEIWLRTGAGDPFRKETEDEKLATFFGEVISGDDDDIVKKIMIGLSKLDKSQWDALESIINTLSGK